ncbi:hypothetical protein F5B18DRAFT_26960 [Nemania serpens]|nr:hypothetical protein F5B18DRAFT_26960 [Nemania serpens]
MALSRRDADCPTGTLFYTCAINHFHGCCSTDPCQSKEGCKDILIPQHTTTSFISEATATILISKSLFATSTAIWVTMATSSIFTSTAAIASPSSTKTLLPTPSRSAVGLIAGLSVGIGVVSIVALVLCIRLYRSRCLPTPSYVGEAQEKPVVYPPPPEQVFELEGSPVDHSIGLAH